MNPKIKHSRDRAFKRFVYIFFFLMCACFVLPLIVVISASFTSEQALTSGGFSLLPRDFTLDAYKSAFSSGTRVLRAYGVTIFQAVVGTVLSSLVAALAAYPLSRSNFRFRRPITVFIFFTMLFGAGMIPNYIIFAKYYKLADSIWIYILPGITGGAWNTMVFRTFFKGLPETLFEAAYLDGASELRIFFSVVFAAVHARFCVPWLYGAGCPLERLYHVHDLHPQRKPLYAAISLTAHDGSGGVHEESCK